jgi:hypothetical protein
LDVCDPCNDYLFDAAVLDEMLRVATDVLFELSGRQFSGSCSDCVRPTARYVSSPGWLSLPNNLLLPLGDGFMINGREWDATCACNKTTRTGCNFISEITLGGYPVAEVTKVLVDGVELDPSEYRVDDYRWLVRLPDANGNQKGWPCCQNMLLPNTKVGTFEVTFTYGVPPPAAGVFAAATLACELAMGCTPSLQKNCRLPRRVTNVARQGVSMVLLDPSGIRFIEGLPEVHLFLNTYNPDKARRRAVVVSPDIPRRVRRVGT